MKLRFFFGKSIFVIFFGNRKYFIYLKNEIGTYKKNLSLLFKGKVVKVYKVNSQEREVSHNWTA